MKTGAENRKQLWVLIGLGLVAAYMVYSTFFSGPSSTPAPAPARPSDASVALSAEKAASGAGPDITRGQPSPVRGKNKSNEFHPVLRSKKKEDRMENVGQRDPSLRLDLLAKVMEVPPAGATRDLFQIMKTPPPKPGDALAKGAEPKVHLFVGPMQPPPPPPPAPPPPPPPPEPIPFKYYGFSTERPDGKRTAYFLFPDGDEIIQAIEGATLKGRYRIVQIGQEKVLVEDTRDKRRQSVTLEPEAAG